MKKEPKNLISDSMALILSIYSILLGLTSILFASGNISLFLMVVAIGFIGIVVVNVMFSK